MERVFIEQTTFENVIMLEKPLETGDYEICTFRRCDFSNADLSYMNFFECEFIDCNLSLVKLIQTTLREVRFNSCKLMGLHFEDCNNLMITLDCKDCILTLSSFYKIKLKKTRFINSKITEVDFTETDLSNSVFENCDLRLTTFQSTNLEGVDFRTSFNYSIDPEINRIKKAKFSLPAIIGLLNKYDIEIDR
jgi:uncharacterized protein YjbI with pentapeptide repeats